MILFMFIAMKIAGISTTRNRALEKATGDYYLFVDSDDYLNPHMIEK